MRTPRLWMAVGLVVTACSYAAEAGSEEEAELDAAAENARQLLPEVAFTVAGILSLSHYSHHPIDDEISGRWLDLYVQSFDYNRRTFLQSDIEEFSTWRTRLDDTVTQPDVDLTLAWLVHDRYLQRFGERMATIDRLLAEPMDLSTGERVQLDREEAPWATTAAELDALWSGLVREEVLRLRLGGKTHEQAVEIVQKRYRRWRRDIESEPPVDVAERYLTALAESYDPHSAWFAPATHDNFDIDMSDSVEGIGAELSSDGDYIVVNKTIPGGPAATSEQVNAGDRIIAVAQAGEPAEDVVGERIDDVVRRIRGPKGTEVQITLWPASATDPAATRVVTLVRDKVKLERAQAKHEVRQIPGADGPLDVALITVPAFYVDSSVPETDPNRRSASADVRRAIEGLPAGVDAVVIDLRGNGGGSLDESIALTGLFIDQGPVVQTRTHRGEIEVYQDEQAGVAWDGPLMVLTDTHSASASEIFASAIQDYGRGLVIGAATTHGKGTVQNVYDLSRQLRRSPSAAVAGALKFTTAKFYRVNGGSTQHRGVLPDVVLPSPFDGLDLREADLDYALPYDEIAPATLTSTYTLDVDLEAVRAASAARIAASDAFRFIAEDVAERRERDGEPVVLDLDARRAEIEANEQEEKARWATLGITPCERNDEGEKVDATCEDPKWDPILDEALAVTADALTHRASTRGASVDHRRDRRRDR